MAKQSIDATDSRGLKKELYGLEKRIDRKLKLLVSKEDVRLCSDMLDSMPKMEDIQASFDRIESKLKALLVKRQARKAAASRPGL